MKNKSVLKDFLEFKKSRSDLVKFFGEDLLNATGLTLQVSVENVITAIDKYLCGDITKNQLVDWVNVLWFTDLFEYKECEANSIASVMTVLESLDEDEVSLSKQDYLEMKECLLRNQEYSA